MHADAQDFKEDALEPASVSSKCVLGCANDTPGRIFEPIWRAIRHYSRTKGELEEAMIDTDAPAQTLLRDQFLVLRCQAGDHSHPGKDSLPGE